ncbi:protein arginine kinase [Thermoanaerobacterium thermosaccharolyticum]|uniref:Protein-arginine kinase n=2 Tax=Thermoanaerobacterium thermosaccharolyticum TaxID=1517 RepID=A0A231VAJ8_THETR|nr:protein arginine kinase [Thermoanaerobacterium thermosaccharolyticum]TCW42459.1 protein arginine kinase [Thermohydrogenium kirishiense]AGB18076.1 arginine kinase [Thermoanaerobacterium thermosaccharolyticum M0795]AST57845.1 ATP:guanido phosphotransferase [Thermoanaerobacterium thermosaccharolyticum]KAA5807001.1 protein arginine kinase [Thermoanaerobacterium thermosaccharolyticum]MBE0069463.1 protein arginine kinase [Thermoanaerobacterium thermosaccharolyticum]
MFDHDNDVVISSRIRLARNLSDIPFPSVMTESEADKVKELVKKAIFDSKTILSTQFSEYDMKKITPLERQSLVERHLISPDLAQNTKNGSALIKNDGTISILINEEDHLRIQTIFNGLNLKEAWDLADKIDDLIEENLSYAFNEKLGYLTACPTNVGTGIRASVMVHLPALTITGQIGNILNSVSKIGIAVRGMYGEGTQSLGDIYQISNQVTLGQSEIEIIENLEGIVKQIINNERKAREDLYKRRKVQIEDRIGRAYGLLTNAKVMSTQEFMRLISDVRLGAVLNIINIDIQKIDEITTHIQPGNLQKIIGKQLEPYERDVKRAEYVSKLIRS